MSKESFRRALLIVLGTFALLAVVAGYCGYRAINYPTTAKSGSGTTVEVEIERGMSFPRVADLLATKGVVAKARWFRLYAMHRGATRKVRPGVYQLKDDMTPEAVLDKLVEGVPDKLVAVTVPEGRNMLEVFALFEAAGVANARALEELARSRKFLDSRGITATTIEGYLFPETYKLRVPSQPREVLDALLDQHRLVWQEIKNTHKKALGDVRRELGWSDHDFVTMASIVEKEAVVDRERRRIAQVFINRLVDSSFVPHRLDTDPTIRYGCMVPQTLDGEVSQACRDWDETDRLRRAQLDDIDNAYNTYQHDGLPPGPISNPGAKSLAAVANPDGSDYLFFVARPQGDGTHVFSKTRAEHDRAVREYVRGTRTE